MHGRKALESRLLLNFQWNFVAVFGIILPIVMASQTFGPFDHFDSVPGTLTTSSGQTVIDTEQVTAARSETSPGVQPEHMNRHHQRPILVIGPESGYVVGTGRGEIPHTLTCRALHAKWIRFKCNNRWMEPLRHVTKQGTDVTSGLPYFEAQLPINRKEVDQYYGFDGFKCECYMSHSPDKEGAAIRSDPATVKIAYLRKHFYSTPVSEFKPKGATVQMPCLPPDGDPRPEIFWKKNGVEIGRYDDSNVILANDGSLIISAARISDSGNYTCGARNIVHERTTNKATLTVFEDGAWSEWTPWTGLCDIDCSKLRHRRRQKDDPVSRRRPYLDLPKRQRFRVCDNPPPKNGGQLCVGPSEEQIDCRNECPIDGEWTEWGKWSDCTKECHQFRRRECGAPRPQNGGAQCFGEDIDSRNCSDRLCNKMGVAPRRGESDLEVNFAMYAGLGAVGLLLLIILAVIFWLAHKKWKICCGKSKDSDEIYYTGNNGHLRTVLSIQPDLTQNALLAHENSLKSRGTRTPGPESSNFSLKSGSSYGQRATRENLKNMSILANSKAALLEGSSSHSSHPPSIDSAEKQRCMSRSSRNSEDHYATLYDFEGSEDPQMQRNSILSTAFPGDIEVESLSVAKVDHRGGRISLPHCGVSVTVPEGALEKRQCEEMCIAVCRNVSDRPKLSEGETLLSPVIWCGPPGISFRKPVTISLPHCAQLFPLNNWDVSLLVNEGLAEESTDWQVAVEVGKETINTQMYCQLDLDSVHVMTDILGRMAVIGRTTPDQPPAIKRHKLAAFAPLYPSTLDYSIRVYCVEDTDAAVQGVVEEEERLGSCMVAETREFTCQDGGDLCFCLEEISPGWQVKPGANYQEIPSTHVWSGTAGLHCSFSLELLQGIKTVNNLSARIVVYQKGASNARQILQINRTALAEQLESGTRSSSAAQTVVSSIGDGSFRGSPGGHANVVQVSNSSQNAFKLPIVVKKRICAALDPPLETENDWRMLARKLGVDRYPQYFGFRSSPTDAILDLWEARESGPTAITQLLQTLRSMDRPDAAAPLESYLSIHPVAL